MKILFLAKPGVFEKIAGDRVQIEQTAEQLRKLNVEVTFGTAIKQNYSEFDLVHVFQLDWNPFCFFHIKEAKSHNKPVVFSAIHHNIQELKRFDDEFVFDFRRVSKLIFKDQFQRDLLKEIYKAIFNPKDLSVVAYAVTHGLKKMYRHALLQSDMVLVQTALEAMDLINTFDVHFDWHIVKNGVGDAYIKFNPDSAKNPFNFLDYLLCVGRIEPRKNQLNVIKAVTALRDELGKDLKLVLIGQRSDKKHFEYYKLIDDQIKNKNWITLVSYVEYNKMPNYFHFAKVGISASWFETTGLTSLEALFCNTNAVASGERAKQYLADYAFYCDPGDISSIKEAIKKAYYAPRPVLPPHVRAEYTWQKAAQDTLAVYEKLLGNEK